MAAKPYKLDRVAIRMVKERPLLSESPITCPDDVIGLMRDLLGDFDREAVAVVNFDTKMKPINMNLVSIGSINRSIFSPPEVMKSALLANAKGLMIFHNHPSGDPAPSVEDTEITGRMAELCDLMGIDLIDHIILGEKGKYFSFHAREIMPPIKRREYTLADIKLGRREEAKA